MRAFFRMMPALPLRFSSGLLSLAFFLGAFSSASAASSVAPWVVFRANGKLSVSYPSITVSSDNPLVLSWKTGGGVSSCMASAVPANKYWTGKLALSGTRNVSLSAVSTKFILKCSDTVTGKSSSASVTIRTSFASAATAKAKSVKKKLPTAAAKPVPGQKAPAGSLGVAAVATASSSASAVTSVPAEPPALSVKAPLQGSVFVMAETIPVIWNATSTSGTVSLYLSAGPSESTTTPFTPLHIALPGSRLIASIPLKAKTIAGSSFPLHIPGDLAPGFYQAEMCDEKTSDPDSTSTPPAKLCGLSREFRVISAIPKITSASFSGSGNGAFISWFANAPVDTLILRADCSQYGGAVNLAVGSAGVPSECSDAPLMTWTGQNSGSATIFASGNDQSAPIQFFLTPKLASFTIASESGTVTFPPHIKTGLALSPMGDPSSSRTQSPNDDFASISLTTDSLRGVYLRKLSVTFSGASLGYDGSFTASLFDPASGSTIDTRTVPVSKGAGQVTVAFQPISSAAILSSSTKTYRIRIDSTPLVSGTLNAQIPYAAAVSFQSVIGDQWYSPADIFFPQTVSASYGTISFEGGFQASASLLAGAKLLMSLFLP